MKTIAGWVIALATIAGTGTAIALSLKPQWASERCDSLSCWPGNLAKKHRPAQRATITSPSQSGLIEQPEVASQAIGSIGLGKPTGSELSRPREPYPAEMRAAIQFTRETPTTEFHCVLLDLNDRLIGQRRKMGARGQFRAQHTG
jgi:hypothetical protein